MGIAWGQRSRIYAAAAAISVTATMIHRSQERSGGGGGGSAGTVIVISTKAGWLVVLDLGGFEEERGASMNPVLSSSILYLGSGSLIGVLRSRPSFVSSFMVHGEPSSVMSPAQATLAHGAGHSCRASPRIQLPASAITDASGAPVATRSSTACFPGST